uniref:Uncharacterized protein n=1 Tax=Setaria viridis TaxID=4556 RepID=A0A4U6SPA4_SETVI|nr:hypothetical protein SEVIR_9G005966v2 [Setaria viridis]
MAVVLKVPSCVRAAARDGMLQVKTLPTILLVAMVAAFQGVVLPVGASC